MTDSDTPRSRPTVLSEELAHRVLTRAVELDLIEQSGMSVERLRDVAREMGIADSAFEAALTEVRQPAPATRPGLLRHWLDRFRGVDRTRSWGDVIFVNAAAFATFWATLRFVSTATRGLTLGWEIETALAIGVNVGALLLARHLRARPVSFVLATTAIAQLAEFAIHLVYGNSGAQGGPTHFAVLLAAALGVGATMFARNPLPSSEPVTAPVDANSPEPKPSSWSMLRTASSYRAVPARSAS